MLNAQASSSLLTVSPPDTFSPRPEFANSNHVSSTFALFSVAGSGLVRLSSFEQEVLSALRLMFKQRYLLRDTREEPTLDLYEFSLFGKPWVHKHAAESERLFIDILAVIFQYGYRFLSTIDYGREQDDRVSIAFSKLNLPPPDPNAGPKTACFPFALSFPSSTLLRVINPPLSNSPAILQAARSGWPRGVVSEKKTGDQIYEFKLKGYKWFQPVTFSTDSLNHIFALLKTLDKYGFTLLTSINLSGNHSRVKDLWIFLGPPEEIPRSLVGQRSSTDLRRSISPSAHKSMYPTATGNRSHELLHRKSGSFPGSSSTLAHARTASEPIPTTNHTLPTPTLLKKAATQKYAGLAPPLRSPLSHFSEEEFPLRGPDYSPIDNERASSSGHVSMDMTGIGVKNMRGNGNTSQKDLSANKNTVAGASLEDNALTPPDMANKTENGRVKTGELFYETGPDRAGARAGYHAESSTESSSSPEPDAVLTPRDSPDAVGSEHTKERADSTPFIMNSAVFRDSAFSSGSTQSMEIPIAWTGPVKKKGPIPEGYDPSTGRYIPSSGTDEGYTGESDGSERISQGSSFRVSTTPRFPVQWQPSPIDERPEHQGSLRLPEDVSSEGQNKHHPERKHVNAERVASPTKPTSPDASRQSEVAIYGMVTTSRPSSSTSPSPIRSSGGASSSIKAEGWVLVNVAEDPGTSSSSLGKSERRKSPPHSSLSPIAKAIVAEDASAPEPKALRKLLPGSLTKTKPQESETDNKQKKGRKPSLRDRWRKKGST